jgi:hypothetical protein
MSRVYKSTYMRSIASTNIMFIGLQTVKHEIFLGDITTFSNIVKKAIQDNAAASKDFQMGHSAVRYATIFSLFGFFYFTPH